VPSAIIADDEPLLRRELRARLAELWPDLQIEGEYADGAAALGAIQRSRPDIAFLDIRMPILSGLEVAERVQGDSQIVFVTAYDEHAVAAFEQGAVDFILKPIDPSRLASTVARLSRRLERVQRLEWIQATVGNTLRFLSVGDVYYFRTDSKYTRVVTADSEALIRRSVKDLQESLDPGRFWRINRGIVVNIEYIDSVVRESAVGMIVRLRAGRAELPVSKGHQSQFRGM
jgi:DNA-binding LytR/AlgR family response regulator